MFKGTGAQLLAENNVANLKTYIIQGEKYV